MARGLSAESTLDSFQEPGQAHFSGYNGDMAKGWESKLVEDQVADRAEEAARVATKGAVKLDGEVQREKQSLALQRERILDERTSNPHRRAALVAALADVEERLGKLG